MKVMGLNARVHKLIVLKLLMGNNRTFKVKERQLICFPYFSLFLLRFIYVLCLKWSSLICCNFCQRLILTVRKIFFNNYCTK
jgi:hypothetical protein